MSPTLTIYTMSHCPSGDETQRTVTQIRGRVPGLTVEIVDLDDPSTQAPPEVFSVPTYMLNGEVVSLGNPFADQLEASIRRFIAGP